jgi:LPXTG-site transpeptidase (sortase) family protein
VIRRVAFGACAAVLLATAAQDAAPVGERLTRSVLRPVPVVAAAPGRGPAGFVPDGAAPTAGTPTRLRIPAIGVDTPLEELHLEATGTLEPPRDFAHAGWFADGAVPGETGPAVIAGHVDSTTGPAVFFRLDRLRPGDPVEVERADGWVAFTVVAVRRYPKAAFPTAQVYGPTPDAELRLITCSGPFDNAQRSYLDNTVVYAVSA